MTSPASCGRAQEAAAGPPRARSRAPRPSLLSEGERDRTGARPSRGDSGHGGAASPPHLTLQSAPPALGKRCGRAHAPGFCLASSSVRPPRWCGSAPSPAGGGRPTSLWALLGWGREEVEEDPGFGPPIRSVPLASHLLQ